MAKLMRRAGVSILVLCVAVLFAGSLAFAGPLKDYPPDWTDKQVEEFVKKPWTQEELKRMGRPPRYILDKTMHPRHTGKELTPKQLYENGENKHRALMFQYGIGISAKDFYKVWIEDEGYKNPKIKLLDLRQESDSLARPRTPRSPTTCCARADNLIMVEVAAPCLKRLCWRWAIPARSSISPMASGVGSNRAFR
jgi:hypothetical protein